MAVTLDEYLHAVYHLDRAFVDGELEERNLGLSDHSQTQGEICYQLYGLTRTMKIRVFLGQRVRINASRYRVPDICVTLGREPAPPILTSPPFLCVEILSPEDRLPCVRERADEFLGMGVSHVWIVDPAERAGYAYSSIGLRPSFDNVLTTKEPDIRIDLNECFSSI